MSDLHSQIEAFLAINAKNGFTSPIPGLAVELLEKALAALRSQPQGREVAAKVEDHKWFDPVCHMTGCQSLVLKSALKRLSFAAQTSGGVAGPDPELQAAIEQAQQALGG